MMSASTHHAQAQARYRSGDLAGARALFEAALAGDPAHPASHHDLGFLLRQLGEHARAGRHVRASLALAPDLAVGWTTVGLLDGDTGAFEAARRALDRAGLIAPTEPTGLIARAALADDDECAGFAARLAAALRQSDLPTRLRARLLHARGRLLDRIGDINGAFDSITAAHVLRRPGRPYDQAEDAEFFESIRDACGPKWQARPGNPRPGPARPVFIVGMPRSGTTLVEQMLSRHRDVAAGGEMLTLQALMFAELPKRIGREFPDCLGVAGPDDWTWLAGRYLEATAPRRSGAPVLTDKLPANFLLVGPILKAFPDARILHLVRDPLDTCLSCYLTDFAHGQNFAGDLDDLGHHFSRYRSLMAHWHGLGDPRLLDVGYQDLVRAPEATLRQVLDHCGLAWDPVCLDFANAEHATSTASWQRVRGGLDPGRIGYWRRYGHRLGRLAGRLASRSGAPADVLRRGLAWEPGLAAGYLALATAAPGAAPDRTGPVLARMPALAGRDAGLLTRAATAAGRAGDPALARRLLVASVRAAPALPAVHLNLAVAHGGGGATDAAIESLHRALALAPGLAEAWSNLGNFMAGRSATGAVAAHCRAIVAAPAGAVLHRNFGLALQRVAGRTGDAGRAFRRAAALAPADRATGMSLHRLGLVDGPEAAGLPVLDRLRCAHPLDAEIHYERGCGLRDAGRDAEAAAALRRALVLEPQHATWHHVLDALLGRAGQGNTAGYARDLFDQYAENFDRHLTERLHYRTPDALAAALAGARPGQPALLDRVLDLGCGTGLMGTALRRRFGVGHLTGVDVSGAMLGKLRDKGGYDDAVQADIIDFLERDAARYDLVTAADVLVYLGALERFMAGARRVLAPGGVLAISVEEGDGAPFELRRSGRHAHRRDYLEATAAAVGLRTASCETVVLREENGRPVSGLIVLMVPAG